LLREFVCSRGEPFCDEVQDWIRDCSWPRFEAGEADPRLLLFLSEDERDLYAVAAHEHAGERRRFFPAMAVAEPLWRGGFGERMFATAMSDAGSRCPDGEAIWRTRPHNLGAVSFFEAMGAEYTCPPEHGPFLLFAYGLD
jgi:hypothetical protein